MFDFIKHFSLLVISLLAFAACSSDSSGNIEFPPYEKGDTLRTSTFVYMMAENNLSGYALNDIAEMYEGAVDVPYDCGMFAFVDDVKLPRILRFSCEAGVPVCDTVCTFDSDFCSSDINEMSAVFDWLLCNYPSRELNVVLWSHGDGWLKDAARVPMQRVIGFDNGENSSSNKYPSVKAVEMAELASFLEELPVKIPFVMFDACFMQCIEVAYELRNCTDWIIASPCEIPANGAPYDKLMPYFFDTTVSPKDIIKSYYDGYSANRGVLLSVIDCSKIEEFADATVPYISKYFSNVSSVDYNAIFQYLKGGYFAAAVSYPCYFDMNGAMMLHLADDEYKTWKEAFDRMVPYSCAAASWTTDFRNVSFYTDYKQFGGVSMYLPRTKSNYSKFNQDFTTMGWYSRVGWDAAGW